MKTEDMVLAAVDGVQIQMDDLGQFWRLARRSRSGQLLTCPRARAETRNRKGYLSVRVSVGGRMRSAFAHRLVWRLSSGPIPKHLQINHINGLKQDNRPANLELSTPSENTRHALLHGLAPRVNGERHPRAKLTAEQVVQIRERHAAGNAVAAIALQFQVTRQAILSVCNRKTWRHV